MSPEAELNTSSSRDTAEGDMVALPRGATSGRRPANALTTSAGARRAAGGPVDDARTDDQPVLLHEAGDLGVGDDERALGGGGERGLEHEARVVGAAVPVLAGAAESVAQERRLGLGDGLRTEHAVPAHVPEAGEEVVGPETGRQLERPQRPAP